MSFYHHSQLPDYRSPFGAVPCKTQVMLAMDVMDEPDTEVVLRKHSPRTGTEVIQGNAVPHGGGIRWNFTLHAPEEAGLIWYDFEIIHAGQVRWYAAPEDGLGGEGYVSSYAARAWQITVYQPNQVPMWPSESVMYQIYVDRFFNGHPDGHVEHVPTGGLVHGHWDDTPFYIRDEKKKVVRWDFFGGNLQGVEAKLDELASLGVNVIYLNPIFDSPSNHKYDTADYRKIDPMYGGEEAFRSLMEAVKARGMRLILDGVFSHTGSDSIYFNREGHFDNSGAYQSTDSPYSSWYRFEAWPDKYDCWWGVETMPNVNELDPGYLAYQLTDADSTVRKWMRYGIDGYRLDVADELPDEFLRQLKSVVREENADAMVLGEVWEDASNKVSYNEQRRYFLGEELDSVTNYPLRDALLELLLNKVSPDNVVRRMKSLQENYPQDQFYSLMNMTGTHDTCRLMTLLGDAPDPGSMTEGEKEHYRLDADKRALAVRRVAMFAAVLFTHPGLPTVYYGDEAGMEGYADPYNRGTYPWGREDTYVKDLFTQLCRLRQSEKLLKRGAYEPFALEGTLYGHWRWQDGEIMLTVINPSQEPVMAKMPVQLNESHRVCWKLTGRSAYRMEDKHIVLNMRGQDYMIIKFQNSTNNL